MFTISCSNAKQDEQLAELEKKIDILLLKDTTLGFSEIYDKLLEKGDFDELLDLFDTSGDIKIKTATGENREYYSIELEPQLVNNLQCKPIVSYTNTLEGDHLTQSIFLKFRVEEDNKIESETIHYVIINTLEEDFEYSYEIRDYFLFDNLDNRLSAEVYDGYVNITVDFKIRFN